MKRQLMFAKFLSLSLVLFALATWMAAVSTADEAARILQETGVKGGLIVHLGCGDAKLLAGLRAGDSCIVQGLDRDPARVDETRRWLAEKGLCGPVSADVLEGNRLPYADNLVNLLVAEDLGGVPQDEVTRVLAPLGMAYLKQGGAWAKIAKPWPKDIDQWTHHLHDSGGNAVANDKVTGPPQHLQWTAGPLWSRSHGWTPSVSAMVSAAGRVFYICDETLTCIDGSVPDKWFLSARDAFSGVLLWKRPVPHWGSRELSGTPATGAGSTTGRFTMPHDLGKRLVAVGDTVYVTLGATAPVMALDAATGQERRTYAGTERADELLCTEGRLIMTLNPTERPETNVADRRNPPPPTPGKRVCAADAQTGKILWDRGPFTAVRATRTQDPFGRLELASGDGRVFILTDKAIEALSAQTGETAWRIDRPQIAEKADRRLGFAGVYEFLLTVMVYRDGIVLVAQPEPNSPHSYHTVPGTLYAFDAASGRSMWKHNYGAWGHCTQPDLFVVGDTVWTHVHADAKVNIDRSNGWLKVPDTSNIDYRIQGLDLRTGELRKELPSKDLFDVGHHHRCYRNKITERFLMASRRGVEFVDLATGENYQNHWVRSGCLLGNLPCNGLLYVAPHDCGCYIEAKLTGFNALAPKSASPPPAPAPMEARLHRGPAYGQIQNLKSEISNLKSQISNPHDPADQRFASVPDGARIPNPSDWPTYRHDPQRSGATESPVPAKLDIAWEASIGARPSGLVVAGGKVFVVGVDAHNVQALSAADGKQLWRFVAGGRIDSPPTIHNGLAIFGSADGRVYAVRASDGALAWRFDAAPRESRVTVADQLESPWPVPGSVLVHDGKCWFAAGRSSYIDEGIQLYALDPASGKVARRQTIYSPDPKTGKMAVATSANVMPGLLNDIPSASGGGVFIRQMDVTSPDGPAEKHLFNTGGFLDSTWFNRTYWNFGKAQTSGLLVLGKDVAYGMELYDSRSRETVFKPGSSAYRLVCLALNGSGGQAAGKQVKAKAKPKAKGQGARSLWEQHVAIRVTALVRAADVVFVAGSPDVVDPRDPHGAWEGRKGGVLAAFAAGDGKPLGQLKLPAPPVWDGMAAAGGKLYLGLMDGRIVCLTQK